MEEMLKSAVEKQMSAVKVFAGEALAWFDKLSPPATRSEKINHWKSSAWFYKFGPPERKAAAADTSRDWMPAAIRFAVGAVAFFPPGTRAEKIGQWVHVAKPYLIAADVLAVLVPLFGGGGMVNAAHVLAVLVPLFGGAGGGMVIAADVLAVLVPLFCGGGGGMGKTMKAPGRNYRMPRSVFESNPKGYFSDLRHGRR